MIARLVKPGEIRILNEPFSSSMVESYTLLDIGGDDAARLLFAASNVAKGEDGAFTITYNANEPVHKMYKAIAGKRRKANPDFLDVSVRYQLDMDAIPGTSVLVRNPEKGTISIAYRKTTNFSKACNINRLFIDNAKREEFFRDVVKGRYYLGHSKYVMTREDTDMYTKWSSYMNDRYFEIVGQLKAKKETI